MAISMKIAVLLIELLLVRLRVRRSVSLDARASARTMQLCGDPKPFMASVFF